MRPLPEGGGLITPHLRKMLGSAEHPTVLALMRQMETQSHATLARGAADQAEELALPVYLAACSEDARLIAALVAVRRSRRAGCPSPASLHP